MSIEGNRYQTSESITPILVEILSRLGVPKFYIRVRDVTLRQILLQDTCKSLGIRKHIQ